jgi:hypothetical protein
MVLKTKTRDIPFIVPTQIFTEEVASDGGVSSNDDSESQMVGMDCHTELGRGTTGPLECNFTFNAPPGQGGCY